MSDRGLATTYEAPLSKTISSEAAKAETTLSAFVLSPGSEGSTALADFVREVLPADDVLICAGAADALSRAESTESSGRPAAVFIFDFRGRHVGDLAEQLRQVKQAHPRAELVILADPANSAAFAACLQVTRSPEALTFLLTPLRREDAKRAIQLVAERYRAR